MVTGLEWQDVQISTISRVAERTRERGCQVMFQLLS
jgi:hypothetical protein